MKKELLFENASLQYEGLARLCRLASPRIPQTAGLRLYYIPMQLVAPRAVTIAVAIDAIICTMNLMVSLFVMVLIFKIYHFYNFYIVQRVGA